MSSFEEAQCGVFDDSGLGKMLDRKKVTEEYGAEVEKIASLLRSLCRSAPTNLMPHELISSAQLVEIRKVARKLLETSIVNSQPGGAPWTQN